MSRSECSVFWAVAFVVRADWIGVQYATLMKMLGHTTSASLRLTVNALEKRGVFKVIRFQNRPAVITLGHEGRTLLKEWTCNYEWGRTLEVKND